MLISNFNLYKDEWLELVFAKRNKEYGAYYIRQHYAQTVLKSFLFGVFGVVVAIGIIGMIIRTKPVVDQIVDVTTTDLLYKIPPATKAQPPKPKAEALKPSVPKAAAPVNMIKDLPPVVAPDILAQEPPTIEELNNKAVGAVDIKGANTGTSGGDGTDKNGISSSAGAGTGEASSNETYKAVEVMPQPVGGDAAWSKFLQSNLRFTDKAMENGVSGKVLVTFIIEKDGQISNIHIERGPGFGLNEEAVRVLKLAKPWKPGMQNGHAVRVQLTLPVNFMLGD
ncbi:MAG TPA: TonB family protein [Mucilaginibacter sp.]|jgi:protein TonB|nr:TonB family protein [Mucilaginibacter sp.]